MRQLLYSALFLVGCKGTAHHTVDAPPVDTNPDTLGTSTDTVPVNAVKLTVRRGTVPVKNVAVYFQDAASTLLEQKLTSEMGIAWAVMPNGGFVTAVEHVGEGFDQLTTFAGVESGDALQIAIADPGQVKQWPFKITIPEDTGTPAAASYQVWTSCSDEPYGFSVPAPMPPAPDNEMLLSGCDDQIADFVIVTYDIEGNPTDRALYAPGVMLPAPPPNPATDAMPPPLNLLALTGSYELFETHTLNYSNVPAHLHALGAYQGVSALRRAYGVTGYGDRSAGSTAAVPLKMPASTTSLLTVTNGYPTSGERGQPLIWEWGPASPTYQLDVGAALLPAYNTAPVYDPGSRSVTWSERTATAQPDLVRSRIHVHRDAVPGARSWAWRMIAPRSATAPTTVVYPQLPVVDFDFNPQVSDTYVVDELTTADVPGGYASFRPHGFGELSRQVIGASGRMVLQMLYFAEL